MTHIEAIRHAVTVIIDADLDLTQTRAAVMSVIPKEFRIAHD
ncbi:hypothetical protein [Pseudarthrobacter sp. S9]